MKTVNYQQTMLRSSSLFNTSPITNNEENNNASNDLLNLRSSFCKNYSIRSLDIDEDTTTTTGEYNENDEILILRSSFCKSYSVRSLDIASLDDTTTTTARYNDETEESALSGWGLSDGDVTRVTFGAVEIREYPITVDDHPKSKDSCPLTLMWEPLHTIQTTVDECEERKRKRTSTSCKCLTLHERRMRITNVQAMSMKDVIDLEMSILRNRVTDLTRSYGLGMDKTFHNRRKVPTE